MTSADLHAMRLYGGQAFSEGLLQVATNDWVFSEIVVGKHVPQLLGEGKTIKNISKFIELVYSGVEKEDTAKLKTELISQAKFHGDFDSHPALKIRLDYAQKFPAAAAEEDAPFVSIFDKWDELTEKITDLYNARLLMLLRSTPTQAEEAAPPQIKSEQAKCRKCGEILDAETGNYCSQCGEAVND